MNETGNETDQLGRMRSLRYGGMRRGIFLLPNLLTSASLFCGFYSILATWNGNFKRAAYAVILSAFFDSADGKVARMTRSTSEFGLQYDSISDVVAFGVAPALLVFHWALTSWGRPGWLAAFLFVACGALRLARFNVQVDVEERKFFTGLPIPGAACMIASTILLYYYLGGEGEASKKIILLAEVYLLALLMVSTIRYPSFKELNLIKRRPFAVMVVLVILLTLVVSEPQIMLFTGSSMYLLWGIIYHIFSWIKGRKKQMGEIEEAVNE